MLITRLLPGALVRAIFAWLLQMFYRVEVTGLRRLREAGDRVPIARSALGAIASAAAALTRTLARLDWRLAAVAGTLVGVLSTLAAITFAVSPVAVGLWLAFFAVLALIGFRSGPVLEDRVGRERVPSAGAITVAEGLGEVVFDMVDLPGGQFQMGAAADEHDNELRAAYESAGVEADQIDEIFRRELPQHTVQVSAFRIMATPVTIGLYAKLVDSVSSEAQQGADQLPAVKISWLDAVEFCNRISARMGFRPCYRKRFGRWRCDWRADGYRLPTEAEWVRLPGGFDNPILLRRRGSLRRILRLASR